MNITSSFAKGEYKLNSIKFNHQNLVISDNKINFTILDLPTPIIDQVTNQSTAIKGLFLSNSHVEVYKDSKLINTVKTNNKGEFTEAIRPLKEFTKISVIGVSHGLKSKPITVSVKDSVAPSITSLSAISDQSLNVTGISEPFGTVKVYMNENNYDYFIGLYNQLPQILETSFTYFSKNYVEYLKYIYLITQNMLFKEQKCLFL